MNATKAKYQALKAAGKLAGTIKDALAKRAAREANVLPVSQSNRFADIAAAGRTRRLCPVTVPLGDVDVLTDVKDANRKLKEWSLGQRAGHIKGRRRRQTSRGSRRHGVPGRFDPCR